MKLFLRDVLYGLTWTLLIGGIVLLIALALLSKSPSALDARKPATWSVDELQR